MKLRCKPGDIAIIINDVKGCDGNLGRFVKVFEPKIHMGAHGYCWTIVPLSPEGLFIFDKGKIEIQSNIQTKDKILHPDKWLKPVRTSEQLKSKEIEDYLT